MGIEFNSSSTINDLWPGLVLMALFLIDGFLFINKRIWWYFGVPIFRIKRASTMFSMLSIIDKSRKISFHNSKNQKIIGCIKRRENSMFIYITNPNLRTFMPIAFIVNEGGKSIILTTTLFAFIVITGFSLLVLYTAFAIEFFSGIFAIIFVVGVVAFNVTKEIKKIDEIETNYKAITKNGS